MTAHPLHPVGLRSHAVSFKALPPLSLYVHVPWCVRKCPYCDFNSHEAKGRFPEAAYIDALIRDLELALPNIWGRSVYTVFLGGGTPSLLSVAAMARLMDAVRARLPLAAQAEITLEANPGTAEAEKFKGFGEAGVNRLSIGIQSFNDAHLKALGRIHNADEARRAIDMAQEHFGNLNLDLMYGLPEQTLEEALKDAETALAFSPQHLSCYHLTLEPNTLFFHHPPNLPPDETSSAMQEGIEELLASNGYAHYETSAFAQPGKQARHNLNYWQFGDYLGIGAGAHSKITSSGKVVREMRHKSPQAYLDHVAKGAPIQEAHELARGDLAFEFMMNALRLNQGFDAALFAERTSLPLLLITRELEAAQARGLLAYENNRIAPTKLGQRFLNDLLEIFLPEKRA
jgi:putative oxygen-independent coproporphyrinogen III oxidase